MLITILAARVESSNDPNLISFSCALTTHNVSLILLSPLPPGSSFEWDSVARCEAVFVPSTQEFHANVSHHDQVNITYIGKLHFPEINFGQIKNVSLSLVWHLGTW